MKLVMAIMSRDDSSVVMDALTEENFQVTRKASTGGFLKSGNTTLIIGVDDSKTNKVIDVISKYSSKRKQLVVDASPMYLGAPIQNTPTQVQVGGAIIFVLDVDRFEKV